MSDRVVVREVPHLKFYSDGTVLVTGLRWCYPHAFTPYRGDSDEPNKKPRYSVVGLMPKTAEYKAAAVALSKHINDVLKESKFGEIPAANKFMRDGDIRGSKPEYKGHYTISAGETRSAPTVRGTRRDPKTGRTVKLTKDNEDEIYGGCWGNILIRPWPQNNKYGKKINAGLIAMQKTRDDEAFGAGRVSEDDIDDTFDEFADDDSGFDDEFDDDSEL